MGFDLIFWGLFSFIDIRINGFDILPDLIGYLLIFAGASKLTGLNNHFTTLRNLALPLAVFSILGIYHLNIKSTRPPVTSFFSCLDLRFYS